MKPGRTADFSHSLTDLMSGLAVMFLLIAAIFMVQSAHATKQARKQSESIKKSAEEHRLDAEELARLKSLDDSSARKMLTLRDDLQAKLSKHVEVRYDPKDPLALTISFTNEKLRFESLSCEVGSRQREELRETLRALVPRLCDAVTGGNADATQTISLEGHTDGAWPLSATCGMELTQDCDPKRPTDACQSQAFENNVRLSARRAQYVFFQAREALRENPAAFACLNQHVVVAGRGSMRPLDLKDTARNRRVEINVRLAAASASERAKP